MHIIPGFLIRQIAGDTLAIPTGEAAHQLSGLLALNGSGVFLFEKLQAEHSVQDLVNAMIEEYDVDEATARTDVLEFLEILRKNGMLVESTQD